MDVVTANELLSGAVVYLGRDGAWQVDLARARLFAPDESEERDAAVVAAKANGRLVGVETEKVSVVDGQVVPKRLRERIRANGPTAPYGPERQDLGDSHVSL
jgi:hypothetical protein